MSINTVTKIEGDVKIDHVIISVADKSGLESFIAGLVKANPLITIYSTGGTFAKISEILGDGSKNLIAVSDYTGQPEMQGGLVKTLDFKIYLGLLSETFNAAHQEDLKRVNGVNFDMVVGNLYPFTETIGKAGSTVEDARGNIDIGGPCMLRASAKNYLRVASVCDPGDYSAIIEELANNNGSLSLATRINCAKKAFRHTATYDTAIAEYLEAQNSEKITNSYEIK